ncbi:LAME_0H09934g1_1 [Lachancea meyersii CBS 8951]|uniref:LAME_0H09934g1_1 n=1 Tax=Lachancea meyersii CBS 8951 TaxID=1266667 RepID=A0A1G4KFN3_9SACH|nr:LAME_0H09934g1_1 [Lachancea meyersii CBS 8951]
MQKKTCSVACIKAHKLQDNCTGTADGATSYLPREDLRAADTPDETNVLVHRDYNFLMGMNRQLELLKRDGKAKNKRALAPSQGYNNPAHQRKRQQYELQSQVIRRGVRCALLPKGMQRAAQNKSKWDKSLDLFVWSIEWCVFSPQGAIEIHHTSHRNKETDSLAECIGKWVEGKCNDIFSVGQTEADDANNVPGSLVQSNSEKVEVVTGTEGSNVQSVGVPDEKTQSEINCTVSSAPQSPQNVQANIKQAKLNWISSLNLQFYIKWFPQDSDVFKDPKKLVPLDPTKSIGELFRDKMVVEYPTVYISQTNSPLGDGFTLLKQNAENGTESQSDSESVDSTSNSDEESDSSSSSDSDEGPPETSSKITHVTEKVLNPKPSIEHNTKLVQSAVDDEGDDDDEDDYTPGISLDFLAD